jgi:GNAT superfamily N-acetyltransferase
MTTLEESNRQFITAWSMFCRRLPHGVVEELPGMVATFGHVALPFFNFCLLSSPVRDGEDLQRRVSAAVDYGEKSGFPWFVGLCEEWLPPGSEEVCREHGLRRMMRLTGMAAERLAPSRRALPALHFRRVSDQAGCDTIADINSSAYGFPPELGRSLSVMSLWDGESYPYIGFLDDDPVTCAATILVEGINYVGWVATLPERSRNGYAEAVMRHSLEQAVTRTGRQRTVLHATEAGLPLYKAMGYETAAHFGVYATG